MFLRNVTVNLHATQCQTPEDYSLKNPCRENFEVMYRVNLTCAFTRRNYE
jgi:hypothetical protein